MHAKETRMAAFDRLLDDLESEASGEESARLRGSTSPGFFALLGAIRTSRGMDYSRRADSECSAKLVVRMWCIKVRSSERLGGI